MADHAAPGATRRPWVPAEFLLHPVVVVALLVWALNDHVLKAEYGTWWTGKLSDVTSLMVFPLVPGAIYEWACALMGRPARHTLQVIAVSALAAAAVMAGINTLDSWATAYTVGLGAAQWPFLVVGAWLQGHPIPDLHRVVLTMDPSDLVTLPAAAFPLWLIGRSSFGMTPGAVREPTT